MSDDKKIGVYICHCGGNISDYVDVERVRAAVENEPGVELAKTTMFACSDASQQDMIDDIEEHGLNGMVVSSCSPKLHLMTFRGVSKRAGLNPYQYEQVNIREQVSWAHTDDREGATQKAIALVKAGIAKARLARPLEPIRIDTVPRALVIGGGISGLRSALGLAELGLGVYLIEKTDTLGGLVASRKSVFMDRKNGTELVAELIEELRGRDNVQILMNAELVDKSGSVGDFDVVIKNDSGETFNFNVGSMVIATGAQPYDPAQEEYGRGLPGVLTLTEFLDLVDAHEDEGGLQYDGRDVESIAYIYCVGSRAEEDDPSGRTYCSRYCCSAALHSAIEAAHKAPDLRQYHLYRDIRTYGKYETIYEEASRTGSFIMRWLPEDPPEVSQGEDGKLLVRVTDQLTENQKVALDVDLVVLVTGLVPRKNEILQNVLKVPIGSGGFYNEIHPKLRPVETVNDGQFLAGSCQFPKPIGESVAAALAATAKTSALLLKGYVELEPLVASVKTDACVWCNDCAAACPYDAIGKIAFEAKEIAQVNRALCKGCGACVPACNQAAIELEGYRDDQVKAVIEQLAKVVIP